MAEENAQESEEAPAGGKPWLLILIVAVLCLGLGAGGAFFALGKSGGAEAAEAAPAEEEAEPVDPAADFRERVVALEPFVVNVDGDGYPRYLKLKVELEADGLPTVAEIDERTAQIRDLTILLLSSKRLADISDFEGKALLKDDLRERINETLESGRVESVLFTEFVVQ